MKYSERQLDLILDKYPKFIKKRTPTLNDAIVAFLKKYEVYIEEPLKTTYKDIDVYKLTTWVQSPVLLQSLNMVENLDVKSMGFNSTNSCSCYLNKQIMTLYFNLFLTHKIFSNC